MKDDKPRWAELGLQDPRDNAQLPEHGSTADLLAFALVLPGIDCPVTGIIDGVMVELAALARLLEETGTCDLLLLLSNRLAVVSLLLRRVDGRAPSPPEYDPDAETATEPPKNGAN